MAIPFSGIALFGIWYYFAVVFGATQSAVKFNREFQVYLDPRKFVPFQVGADMFAQFLAQDVSSLCSSCNVIVDLPGSESEVQEYIRFDTTSNDFTRNHYVVQLRNKAGKKASSMTIKKNDADLELVTLSPVQTDADGQFKFETKFEMDIFPCRVKYAKSMKLKSGWPYNDTHVSIKKLGKYFHGLKRIVPNNDEDGDLVITLHNARTFRSIPFKFDFETRRINLRNGGSVISRKRHQVKMELVIEATFDSLAEASFANTLAGDVQVSIRVVPANEVGSGKSAFTQAYLKSAWDLYSVLIRHPWALNTTCIT